MSPGNVTRQVGSHVRMGKAGLHVTVANHPSIAPGILSSILKRAGVSASDFVAAFDGLGRFGDLRLIFSSAACPRFVLSCRGLGEMALPTYLSLFPWDAVVAVLCPLASKVRWRARQKAHPPRFDGAVINSTSVFYQRISLEAKWK